jgi:hypothetical protein
MLRRIPMLTATLSVVIEFRVGWIAAALILVRMFFALPELAVAQESYCPKSISVTQTIEKVPEGWSVGPG